MHTVRRYMLHEPQNGQLSKHVPTAALCTHLSPPMARRKDTQKRRAVRPSVEVVDKNNVCASGTEGAFAVNGLSAAPSIRRTPILLSFPVPGPCKTRPMCTTGRCRSFRRSRGNRARRHRHRQRPREPRLEQSTLCLQLHAYRIHPNTPLKPEPDAHSELVWQVTMTGRYDRCLWQVPFDRQL